MKLSHKAQVLPGLIQNLLGLLCWARMFVSDLKMQISELTFACLDSKTYYGGWSGGILAEKLRSSCTEGPQALWFFWTWNTIFTLSIDLILCALSQCYNSASFPSRAAREEDVEEKGTDYAGRKEGSKGSYTQITRPIQLKWQRRHLSWLTMRWYYRAEPCTWWSKL